MISVHLGHQVILGSLGPGCQALELLCARLRAMHIDTGLEVELELGVIRAGVKVGLRIAAFVEAGASFGITKQEGALEGTSDWLCIFSEHGVHGRVSSNVVTKRFKRVKICFTIACNQNNSLILTQIIGQ